MEKLEFNVGEALDIELQNASSDAAIKGWDQDTVEITIDGDANQCGI